MCGCVKCVCVSGCMWVCSLCMCATFFMACFFWALRFVCAFTSVPYSSSCCLVEACLVVRLTCFWFFWFWLFGFSGFLTSTRSLRDSFTRLNIFSTSAFHLRRVYAIYDILNCLWLSKRAPKGNTHDKYNNSNALDCLSSLLFLYTPTLACWLLSKWQPHSPLG